MCACVWNLEKTQWSMDVAHSEAAARDLVGLPKDILFAISAFLTCKDVTNLMCVSERARQWASENEVWETLYHREYPVMGIGPTSTHLDGASGACVFDNGGAATSTTTCRNLRHYTGLVPTTRRRRRYVYGDYRRAYAKRAWTVDRHIFRAHPKEAAVVKGLHAVDAEIQKKMRQIKHLRRRRKKLLRAALLHKGDSLDSLYAWV